MTNFCTAITLKGTRCKCKASSNSKFCKIHLPRDLTHKDGICDYINDARHRCKCQNKVVGKEFTFCKEHIDIKIFCENLVNNEKCWNVKNENSKYCETCLRKMGEIELFLQPNIKFVDIDQQPSHLHQELYYNSINRLDTQIQFTSLFVNTIHFKTLFQTGKEGTLEYFREGEMYFSNMKESNTFYIIENRDGKSFMFIYIKALFKGSIFDFYRKIGPLETYFDPNLFSFYRIIDAHEWTHIYYYKNGLPIAKDSYYQFEYRKTYDNYFYDQKASTRSFNNIYDNIYFCVRDGKVYQCCNKSGMILAIYSSKSSIDWFNISLRNELEAKTKNGKTINGIISTYEFTEKDKMLNDLFKEKMKLENVCKWLGKNHLSFIIRNILIEETLRLYRINFQYV